MKRIHLYSILAVIAVFTACKKEPLTPPSDSSFTYAEDGVLILNEGFSVQTSSVDFYSYSGKLFKDIYRLRNNADMGLYAQSMAFKSGEGYIVINGSGKILVVDDLSFIKKDSIMGFASPRYMLPVNDSIAYVTDWYTDESIVVVNMKSRSIVKKLPNGNKGPERLLKVGNKVFVVNQGIYEFPTGFKADSTVTVIDPETHTISGSITLSAEPSSLQVDKNGFLWVLCAGIPDYDNPANGTPAWLHRVDPSSQLVLNSFQIGGNEDHPFHLVVDYTRNYLAYAYDNKVFKFHIDSLSLPEAPFIEVNASYSIAIDPVKNVLYVSDPKNYSQNGEVFRYDFSTGASVGSVEGGITPGNFYFR